MAGQIKDHSNSTKVPAQQLVTHSEVNMPLELRLVVTKFPNIGVKSQIRYDTRCYFNVRSKADISQLNLPHGTDN